MGRLGEERERVRQVAAGGLDRRKASEDHQRNEKPTLADVVRVTMTMGSAGMSAVAMAVRMGSMRSMAPVGMIAVTLVRVWHERESP
jgi:hypothetical protein